MLFIYFKMNVRQTIKIGVSEEKWKLKKNVFHAWNSLILLGKIISIFKEKKKEPKLNSHILSKNALRKTDSNNNAQKQWTEMVGYVVSLGNETN